MRYWMSGVEVRSWIWPRRRPDRHGRRVTCKRRSLPGTRAHHSHSAIDDQRPTPRYDLVTVFQVLEHVRILCALSETANLSPREVRLGSQ
jgi:hypothetical protein